MRRFNEHHMSVTVHNDCNEIGEVLVSFRDSRKRKVKLYVSRELISDECWLPVVLIDRDENVALIELPNNTINGDHAHRVVSVDILST